MKSQLANRKSKMQRIGVFICGCGPNIAGGLNFEELKDFASSLPGVKYVFTHQTLCSDDGRGFIREKVKKTGLTHIVICACSPHEHETTFRETAREADISPYLIQVVDIREGVIWITPNRDEATDKARAYLAAGVERVKLHRPLSPCRVEFSPNVLVVGGGVAGVSAALTLARGGRKVCLVEKEFCLGGMAARLDKVFQDSRCASCLLEERLNEALHSKNIELFLGAQISEVLGFYGNFFVRINKKAAYIDEARCLGCGACLEICKYGAISLPYPGGLPHIAVLDKDKCLHFKGEDCKECLLACPFGAIDLGRQDTLIERRVGSVIIATGFEPHAYIESSKVLTSFEFEQMLKEEILDFRLPIVDLKYNLKSKASNLKPQIQNSFALIHCQRDGEDRSSLVSDPTLIKFSRLIKEKLPEAEIFHFYRRLNLADKESCKGVYFIEVEAGIEVFEEEGKLILKDGDTRLSADLIISGCRMYPPKETERLARLFGIELGADGFLAPQDEVLLPFTTMTRGVFIAGCISGPKDIPSSISQAEAVAAEILSITPGGEVGLEAATSWIDSELCGGCKICLGTCPYQAIYFDQTRGICEVNEILCQGCGSCAAACPSGAIESRHFTYEQISKEIAGLIAE